MKCVECGFISKEITESCNQCGANSALKTEAEQQNTRLPGAKKLEVTGILMIFLGCILLLVSIAGLYESEAASFMWFVVMAPILAFIGLGTVGVAWCNCKEKAIMCRGVGIFLIVFTFINVALAYWHLYGVISVTITMSIIILLLLSPVMIPFLRGAKENIKYARDNPDWIRTPTQYTCEK